MTRMPVMYDLHLGLIITSRGFMFSILMAEFRVGQNEQLPPNGRHGAISGAQTCRLRARFNN